MSSTFDQTRAGQAALMKTALAFYDSLALRETCHLI